jgi:hypothetical protein
MSSLSDVNGFLPRITRRDGRAIEAAPAGQNLLETGIDLRGGVVEATFASSDPPLLRRLAQRGHHVRQSQSPRTQVPAAISQKFAQQVVLQLDSPIRLERLHQQLVDARDLASIVTRVLQSDRHRAPSFAHLDRWLAVLALVTERAEAASPA